MVHKIKTSGWMIPFETNSSPAEVSIQTFIRIKAIGVNSLSNYILISWIVSHSTLGQIYMLYMYSFNKLLHYFALIQPELKRMFRILQNQHLIHTTHGLASVTIILKPGRIDSNTLGRGFV